jgi:hypothetical protein
MFAHRQDGCPTTLCTVHDEAARWVADEIARMRELPYDELIRYESHALHCEMLSAQGAVLIRETQVVSDGGGKGGDLRVMVDVWNPDGGGRRRLVGSLAKDDFIMAPDGTFVGE